jgi:hypothetical protein
VHKRKRELVRLAEGLGLQKVSVTETKGNHYRVEALYNGKTIIGVTSYSPSDHRAGQNFKSYLNRSMRAIDNAVVKIPARMSA